MSLLLLSTPVEGAEAPPHEEQHLAIVAPVAAAEQSALLRPPVRPEALCGPGGAACGVPDSPVRMLLVGGASAGLLAGSAALGIAGGRLLPAWHSETYGRPDPLVTSLGVGLGFGMTVAASQLLVPLAARLGGGEDAERLARSTAWQSSRWAVLAGGIGVGVLTTGALMERRDFGSGQALMLAGGGTVVLSALVYTGLELVGVVAGSGRARR